MLSSGSSSSVGVGAQQHSGMSTSGQPQSTMTSSYSNERPGSSAMLSGSSASGGLSSASTSIIGGSIEVEYASDPASGGFFQADYKKHDDLKQMLDSNKDNLKLEAMKRIIAMVAKGRDASDLFPAVVKNVVSKNIEVKKLVYVYLVRYAEEQQDLALLSISTFQRALKDPNQLIRAGALRVLSSIRVSMIVPIVMLAIRDSASDMSPYVRKTAAHAIPKLYSLDVEQKEELIGVIEKLLSDRTTLVVGSAVMAFEEVCPERVDLIHKNYRKLCNLLVDVDEWGQIIIINMLTRYARTQFVDPNRDDYDEMDGGDAARPFYDETTSDEDDDDADPKAIENESNADGDHAPESSERKSKATMRRTPKKVVYQLDADHRLLLRQTKPLLQSRNASVVMTVAQLYHHIAPRNEVALVAKALIRLMRSHKEVQSVVLTCIASMSTQRKSIFELYIKSFFVRTSSDATHIKLLKLEILTNLATGASISVILREFQTYISSNDKAFVAATIQAIGRCAASIREVTETCLSGLVHLLSNRDEYVVAESVVVIKQLLQTQAADHFEIISQMAKLLDFITVAAARAAILWLIGEYNEKVPRIGPDVLRKLAKSFVDEEDIVKLQILNLAVKLYLTNAQQTELLCQYVFSLARYDPNYDVRDRARFLKQFIFPATEGNGKSSVFAQRAREIFLAAKPAPQLESKYQGREKYQLGSLSHYLNMRANGYHDMPAFPDIAPDSSVRHVESPVQQIAVNTTPLDMSATMRGLHSLEDASTAKRHHKSKSASKATSAANAAKKEKSRSFYSESEKSSSSYNGSSSEEDVESNAVDVVAKKKSKGHAKALENENDSGTSDSAEDSSSSASSSDEESSDEESSSSSECTSTSSSASSSSSSASSDEETSANVAVSTSKTITKAQSFSEKQQQPNGSHAEKIVKSQHKPQPTKSNLDLLLDLDDIAPAGPIMTPSLGGFLTPAQHLSSLGAFCSDNHQPTQQRIELIGPSYIPLERQELLSALSGNGVAIAYRFTRAPHLFSGNMSSVELAITNTLDRPLCDVHMIGHNASSIKEFATIATLAVNATVTAVIGIDFNDSTQPAQFAITAGDAFGPVRVQLRPTCGDLVRSVAIDGKVFAEERAKLRGMNEHTSTVALKQNASINLRTLQQRIFEYANVALVPMVPDESQPPAARRLHFAGQTLSSRCLVLIAIELPPDTETDAGSCSATLSVSCEKMVIGSMALSELRAWLMSGSW